jgi:hypothetical protein
MQQVDGLPWLACPWSPSSWYSKIYPSSAHSSFESIAGKATTHNKHSCIHDSHPRHASHNSIIEYQKQTCSDIWFNNHFYKGINHSNNSKQFLLANKPESQANNLQASMEVKTWHLAYFQIANNITEPTQLETNQKSKRLNYNEFPILT